MPEAAKRRLVIQDQLKLFDQEELLIIQNQLTILSQDNYHLTLTQKQLKFRTVKAVSEAICDIESAKENIAKIALNLSLEVVPYNGTSRRIASLKILLGSATSAIKDIMKYYTAYCEKSEHKEEKPDSNNARLNP